MKTIKTCISVILIFTLSACSAEMGTVQPVTDADAVNEQTLNATDDSSDKYEKHAHQSLVSNMIARPHPYIQVGMTIDLPVIGLESVNVRIKESGRVTSFDQYPLYVYIISDYRYKEMPRHDSYLAVETENEMLFFDFSNACYEEITYLCDVDGDGIDEIVVQQLISINGGAGSFISRVFKVVDNEIREIFMSPVYHPSGNWNAFDSGFISEFLSGYRLQIINIFTGYTMVLDISKRYNEEFFDEDGKGKREKIWCDSFCEFVPEDVDGDGIFEIACLQYVSLQGHSDGIGFARTVLKFNPLTLEFEVIQTEFIPTKNLEEL